MYYFESESSRRSHSATIHLFGVFVNYQLINICNFLMYRNYCKWRMYPPPHVYLQKSLDVKTPSAEMQLLRKRK